MKYKILSNILLYLFFSSFVNLKAQKKIKALFLGNSYTYANNLPQLIYSLALTGGDTLVWDSNTPGGYTLQMHSNDATSLAKIATGGWDVVIVQAQSQEPSFDTGYVNSNVFPYARKLDSLVHLSNPCTETIFFMTWGRKNGDAGNCAAYPPVCTYLGMQGKLRERYLQMGDFNQATVSPVGCVWREVVQQNPSFDLYQPDQSHPSIYGSYLAACVFQRLLFQKSCSGNSFVSTLSSADASLIQQSTDHFFNDSLSVFFKSGNMPFVNFSFQVTNNSVQFSADTLNISSLNWNFGDGNSSSSFSPIHTYLSSPGVYPVTLTGYSANNCHDITVTDTVVILSTGFSSLQQDPIAGVFLSNGILKIECTSLPINEILIHDISGRMILRKIITEPGDYLIPFHYPSGIYLVYLQSDSFSKSFRFFNP